MCLPLAEGGKQILDLHSRNEAIDLWNLKEFLRVGDDRANWPFFVEHTIFNRWNACQTSGNHGLLSNIFLQNIHIPLWRNDPLAHNIRRMLQPAKKYHLEFTALSISKEILLQMPVWNHIGLNGPRFEKIRRKEAVKCLRRNHQARIVADIVTVAGRKSTLIRQPHMVNPSGIGRKNCGCPLCRRDRIEYGCENPGECIEAAKLLLECIHPKWNPLTANNDLIMNEYLALSEIKKTRNDGGRQDVLTFNPAFRLTDLTHGLRIFATENHTTEIPTKRYNIPAAQLTASDVYLHAKIKHSSETNAQMQVMILVQENEVVKMKQPLILSILNAKVRPSFNTAILGGLLYTLGELPKDIPLTVHSCSGFLGKSLVSDRVSSENNPLGPYYELIKSVISTLQERSGRTHFKKGENNPAIGLSVLSPT
jgi:hypothetical protein